MYFQEVLPMDERKRKLTLAVVIIENAMVFPKYAITFACHSM